MSWLDLFWVLIGMILTALAIRLIQSGPVEGPVNLLDLLAPNHDPRTRVLSIAATFVVPILVGGLLCFPSSNKIGVATLGPALGAWTSVATAFFRPDTLAPTIRDHLRRAQTIYASFVLGYAALGTLSAVVYVWAQSYFERGSVVNNLIAWLITALVSIVATTAWRLIGGAGLGGPGQHFSDAALRRLVQDALSAALAENTRHSHALVDERASSVGAPPDDLRAVVREILREELDQEKPSTRLETSP